MSSHFRKSNREKKAGFTKINRLSGREGVQLVRLSDVSNHGIAFETLTKSPYVTGEKILVLEVEGVEVLNRMSTVRHVSSRKNEDGEDIYAVGVEYDS